MIYKLVLLFTICVVGFFPLLAQRGSSCPEDLVPKYGQNRQWGYTNILGQWVIQPIYTKVSPYVENKAVVMRGLLYGVIDCDGNVVLSPQYEMLSNYRYGKIWAKQNGLWSLLGEKGKVLMMPQFQEIEQIANTELTWVLKDGLWGLLNEQRGNYLCRPQFKMMQIMSDNASLVELNDYYGVVNHVNCQFLIPPEITKVKKVAPRIIIFQQKGKWGLFSEFGVIRLNPEFDTLIVKYSNVLEGRKGGLSGLYDLTGKELLSPVFQEIGEYNEGYFPVRKDGKFGYASRFGKLFIQPSYQGAFPFKNQSAIVKQGSNYGVIDIRNKFMVPAKYPFIARNYDAGYFIIREKDANGKNKYFLMNEKFKKIVSTGFDSVFVADTAAFTRVSNDNKISFINALTSKNVFSGTFEEASPFQYHLARVKNNNKWGVINETGQNIVPYNNDSVHFVFWGERLMIQMFIQGKVGITDATGKVIVGNGYDMVVFAPPNLLKVKKLNKYGLIKTTGGEVVPLIYDFMSNGQENPLLPEWPSVIGKGSNQYGLMNEKGEVITEDKYSDYAYLGEKYYSFSSGKSKFLINAKGEKAAAENFDDILSVTEGKFAVKKGKKWGYINSKGITVVPLEYEEAFPFENKLAVVKKNGKFGAINASGKMMIEPTYETYNKSGKDRVFSKEGKKYILDKTGELNMEK